METIRKVRLVAILVLVGVLSSCTKYQYIDTGLANGNHDCTMWEYFQRDDFNWKYTREFIEHAQMTDMFKTRDNNITFLAFTSMSVENYLIDNQYEKVSDLDVEFCQDIIKRHIIKQKIMSTDVPRGNRIKTGDWDDYGEVHENIGGKTYESLSGELFMYAYQADYDNVPEKGAIELHFASLRSQGYRTCDVASSNIVTQTGVVHSIEYGFRLGEL